MARDQGPVVPGIREEDVMVKARERWKPGDGIGQSRRPTFHGDVLDGKAEDDGPDHAQGHFHVPIHDFYRNSSRTH